MTKVFSKQMDLHKIIISRAQDKISTELDGETVILDISSGIYSGLDPVGTTIWNALEKQISIAGIVEMILENYDVSRQECTDDTIVFLNSLIENGLIVVQDAPNP